MPTPGHKIPDLLAAYLAKKRAATDTGSHGQKVKLNCPDSQQHNTVRSESFHEPRPLQKAAKYESVEKREAREAEEGFNAGQVPLHEYVSKQLPGWKRAIGGKTYLSSMDGPRVLEKVPLHQITYQPQVYRGEEHLDRYRKQIAAFKQSGLDPVEHLEPVTLEPSEGGWYVRDGNHRIGAARDSAMTHIKAWTPLQKDQTMKLARRALGLLVRKGKKGTRNLAEALTAAVRPDPGLGTASGLRRDPGQSLPLTSQSTPVTPTDGLPTEAAPVQVTDSLGRPRNWKQQNAYRAKMAGGAKYGTVDPLTRIAAGTKKMVVGEPDESLVPLNSFKEHNGVSDKHLTAQEKTYHGGKAVAKVGDWLPRLFNPEELLPAIKAGMPTMGEWYQQRWKSHAAAISPDKMAKALEKGEPLDPSKINTKELGMFTHSSASFSPQNSPLNELHGALDRWYLRHLHKSPETRPHHRTEGDIYKNAHKDPTVHERLRNDYGAGMLVHGPKHPRAGQPIVRKDPDGDQNLINLNGVYIPTSQWGQRSRRGGQSNQAVASERVLGTEQLHPNVHRHDVMGTQGDGLKTDNYAVNMLGNRNQSTNDVHHIRNMGLTWGVLEGLKDGSLKVPPSLQADWDKGNHYKVADLVSKTAVGNPAPYLAVTAATRRAAELAGVPVDAAQAAMWGARRAAYSLAGRHGWDAEKIAAEMTHRDIHDSSGWLGVMAHPLTLARIEQYEKEGALAPGAYKSWKKFIKDNTPPDEILNSPVQAPGTKELVPFVEKALREARQYALTPEAGEKALASLRNLNSRQEGKAAPERTEKEIHALREKGLQFARLPQGLLKMARKPITIEMLKAACGKCGPVKKAAPTPGNPPVASPNGQAKGSPAGPGSLKDEGGLNNRGFTAGAMKDKGTGFNNRAYTASAPKPDPAAPGVVKKANLNELKNPGGRIGGGAIKVKKTPLRSTGPHEEPPTEVELHTLAERLGQGADRLHEHLKKGPLDQGGYRHELVVKKAALQPAPPGSGFPIPIPRPEGNGGQGSTMSPPQRMAPPPITGPAAPPTVRPPAIGGAGKPEERDREGPRQERERYAEMETKEDSPEALPPASGKPQAAPAAPKDKNINPLTGKPRGSVGSVGVVGGGSGSPGPRRYPVGRNGYAEQQPDGSWEYVNQNTGRRDTAVNRHTGRPIASPAPGHLGSNRAEWSPRQQAPTQRPGGRRISAKGLLPEFMTKPIVENPFKKGEPKGEVK